MITVSSCKGHFLVGHLLAQPATQAPNTLIMIIDKGKLEGGRNLYVCMDDIDGDKTNLAENPGHTAIQASSSSPELCKTVKYL